MESKKINQLATAMSPSSTDLTIIGDPISGVSKKATLQQISSLFGSAVSFYTNLAAFPATGTIDTLYCAKDTNKLYLWSGSAYVQTFPSQSLLDTYQLKSEKGASNGYASLDSSGKVPISQLPSSIMEYKGMWNASTNTPTLANGTGDTGDVYICNAAGTVNFGAGAITFAVGDYVVYSGTIWQRSSGAVGTVTSVAVTESGDALTITGSPVTTSGTINIGFAGTSAQYVAGDGSLVTFPSLTGYVPYTGANANVDLGEYELKAGQLTLDVSPTGTASVGTTKWNNTIGSSETTLKGGSVILKNGVDLVARVVNKVTPNTTLTKAAYSAVRVSGASGQRLAVAYAQANNDNNSADTIGLVTETIATNQEGFIITVGQLLEINTTGSLQGETWADGDVLYLSPTTPGALTNVKPNGLTGHIVVMGYVEYAHAVHGSIYVKVMNGWELDELHNVYITSPSNNQGLFYNSSNSLWENKSIATALGYTPADDSLVVKLAGTQTITGEKTFSSTYGITIDGNGTNAGGVNFKLYTGASARGFGYSTIYSVNNNIFAFYYPIDSSNNSKQFKFDLTSLTTNAPRTYLMPDASGTLALTSQIPSLSGYVQGTGTTNYLPKFTGASTIGNSSIVDDGSAVSAYTNAFRVFQIGGSGAAFYLSGNTTQATMSAITSTGAYQDLAISGSTLTFFSGTLGSLGSSLAMTINPSGNVSIGNSNDTYKLDVSGTGRFTGALTGTSATFSSSVQAANMSIGIAPQTDKLFVYNASGTNTGLTIQQDGTGDIFRANGNSGANRFSITQSGAATFSSSVQIQSSNGIKLNRSANDYYWQINSDSSNYLNFGAYLANGTAYGTNPKMIIKDDGNVGIGTTTPAAKLVVSTATDVNFEVRNGADYGLTGVGIDSRDNARSVRNAMFVYGNPIVLGGGNVGIGTSSPSWKLDVRGTGMFNGDLQLDLGELNVTKSLLFNANSTTGGSYGNLKWYNVQWDGNTRGEIVVEGDGALSNGRMIFKTGASGSNATERMRITSGGTVCIGRTSAPSSAYKLAVQDAVMMAVSTNNNNMINFFNQSDSYVASIVVNASSVAYNTSSDYRLKTDLKDFGGLNLLSNIKVYDFAWKLDNTRTYGVIAHELAEVLPSAVSGQKDGEEIQGVDYSKIVPILVKSIQEQQEQIEELKLEIDELKNK